MSLGHDHGTAAGRHRGRLALVLAITTTVMVAEVVGAALTGSLALFADAGHMLSDGAGLALALVATYLATRPGTPSRTFGLQRAEILAALANGVILTVVGVVVIIEAIQRLAHPVVVEAPLMVGVAIVGLIANVIGLILLRPGHGESLNVRGAYLEVFADLIGSVAVILAAVIIQVTGWERADALASIGIGLFVLPRAFVLLRDVVHVLLEGTPREMNLAEVRQHIRGVDGVLDVHDLHAWTITSGVPVLSAHVVVDDRRLRAEDMRRILCQLGDCLSGHFDVEHSTFQLEPVEHQGREPAAHS